MIKTFQRVLAKSEGRVPVYLQTDKSKEFIAQLMQKFLKENDILFQEMRNPDIKVYRRALQQKIEGANVTLLHA